MKCLMRMFAEDDKGVVFYETVLSIKAQKHTFIECVPLPWEQFELLTVKECDTWGRYHLDQLEDLAIVGDDIQNKLEYALYVDMDPRAVDLEDSDDSRNN